MIRINLVRDATQAGGRVPSFTSLTSMSDSGAEVAGASKENFIKIALMFLPMIGLMLFQEFNMGEKQSELLGLQQQVSSIRENVEKLKPEIEEVRRFSEEKGRLIKQMEAIRKLSRERLKNIKAISALQGLIPPKVWLRSIRIDGSKVSLEGNATEDLVISEFMQGLDQSIFFSSVELRGSQDNRGADGAQIKDFSVECQLEQI
jgi:Tfp pilus assembly protein PilN